MPHEPPFRSDENSPTTRFARTALGLHERCSEFEIQIPEGLDESEVAAAFRAEGCGTTYLTQRRTLIVAR